MNKTPQDIKDIIQECPKTFNAIKQYYLKKEKGIDAFITDNLVILSVSQSPYSVFQYFDTVDLIASLHYDHLSGGFIVNVNGKPIKKEEEWLGSNERNEALILAVIYLFEKQEKTL